MPVLAFVMSALVLVGAIAEAQTAGPASGLAAVRARLVAPNGTLLIAPESNVDLDAGAMAAAEGPDLVALALACATMPARTQVTILGTMTGAPVKAKIERDKGGRLEVQLRGIPFADRARLLEVTEAFLAKGANDVRVGATLTLRPAGSGATWEYESPSSGGLTWARGTVRAEGGGNTNAEALALSGRVTAADEGPGGRPGQGTMLMVLRREGAARRGTVTGSNQRSITIEFAKEGVR
jgi:hypothetical protein